MVQPCMLLAWTWLDWFFKRSPSQSSFISSSSHVWTMSHNTNVSHTSVVPKLGTTLGAVNILSTSALSAATIDKSSSLLSSRLTLYLCILFLLTQLATAPLFAAPDIPRVSSSAFPFPRPSQHAWAMLLYSSFVDCPCFLLLYTFFLHWRVVMSSLLSQLVSWYITHFSEYSDGLLMCLREGVSATSSWKFG